MAENDSFVEMRAGNLKQPEKFGCLFFDTQFQPLISHTRTFMRNLLLLLVVLGVSGYSAVAQQDAQYTMYMFNRLALNPAYAGALEATNFTLLGRAQWVGVPGAPKTSTISGSGYLKGINSGIGGVVIADQIGPLRTIGLGANYAFHMKLGSSSRLNIGVQAGFYQKGLFVPKENWKYDETSGVDPVVPLNDVTSFVPDFGAGLYYHKLRKNLTNKAYPQDAFYIGASVNHLLEPSLEGLLAQQVGPDSKVRRNIAATAGVTIPITKNILLQPSTYFRTNLSTFQNDLTVNLYVSPMVFGINYRGMFIKNNESIGGIVGFNANTSMFIGYAYDFNISRLSGFTSGSHELIISYTLPTANPIVPPVNDVEGNSSF